MLFQNTHECVKFTNQWRPTITKVIKLVKKADIIFSILYTIYFLMMGNIEENFIAEIHYNINV